MANVAAKTSSNVFYKARCTAATHNEQLSSREGAADIMSIDRGRLYRIESGIANPYPEEIHLMADLYNAPELENYSAELKRGQAIDSEGEVVLDKNFRPAYSAERGETMYQRNLRNRGRRVEIKPEYRKMAQDRICTTQIEYEQLMM